MQPARVTNGTAGGTSPHLTPTSAAADEDSPGLYSLGSSPAGASPAGREHRFPPKRQWDTSDRGLLSFSNDRRSQRDGRTRLHTDPRPRGNDRPSSLFAETTSFWRSASSDDNKGSRGYRVIPYTFPVHLSGCRDTTRPASVTGGHDAVVTEPELCSDKLDGGSTDADDDDETGAYNVGEGRGGGSSEPQKRWASSDGVDGWDPILQASDAGDVSQTIPNSVVSQRVVEFLDAASVGRLALTCRRAFQLAKRHRWLKRTAWRGGVSPEIRPRLWMDVCGNVKSLQLAVGREIVSMFAFWEGTSFEENHLLEPDDNGPRIKQDPASAWCETAVLRMGGHARFRMNLACLTDIQRLMLDDDAMTTAGRSTEGMTEPPRHAAVRGCYLQRRRRSTETAPEEPEPSSQTVTAAWHDSFVEHGDEASCRRHDDTVLGTVLYEYLVNDAYVNLSDTKKDEIHRDVSRTFPHLAPFRRRGSLGQRWMFDVLKAVVCLESSVGYCQGMNFVVAGLLLHLRCPVAAFWMMVALLRYFHCRNIFSPLVPQVSLRLFQFNEIVKDRLPRLWRHVTDHGLQIDFFSQQWLMSIFAYYVDPSALGPIWDTFFLSGWKALFKYGLAYLLDMEADILRSSGEEILQIIQASRKTSRHQHRLRSYSEYRRGSQDDDAVGGEGLPAPSPPHTSPIPYRRRPYRRHAHHHRPAGKPMSHPRLMEVARRFKLRTRELEQLELIYLRRKMQTLLAQLPLDRVQPRHVTQVLTLPPPETEDDTMTVASAASVKASSETTTTGCSPTSVIPITGGGAAGSPGSPSDLSASPAENVPRVPNSSDPLGSPRNRAPQRSVPSRPLSPVGEGDRLRGVVYTVDVETLGPAIPKLRQIIISLNTDIEAKRKASQDLETGTPRISGFLSGAGSFFARLRSKAATRSLPSTSPKQQPQPLPPETPTTPISSAAGGPPLPQKPSPAVPPAEAAEPAPAPSEQPRLWTPTLLFVSLREVTARNRPYEGCTEIWDWLENCQRCLDAGGSPRSSFWFFERRESKTAWTRSFDVPLVHLGLPDHLSAVRLDGLRLADRRYRTDNQNSKHAATICRRRDCFQLSLGLWGVCLMQSKSQRASAVAQQMTLTRFGTFQSLASSVQTSVWTPSAATCDAGYLVFPLSELLKCRLELDQGATAVAQSAMQLQAKTVSVDKQIGALQRETEELTGRLRKLEAVRKGLLERKRVATERLTLTVRRLSNAKYEAPPENGVYLLQQQQQPSAERRNTVTAWMSSLFASSSDTSRRQSSVRTEEAILPGRFHEALVVRPGVALEPTTTTTLGTPQAEDRTRQPDREEEEEDMPQLMSRVAETERLYEKVNAKYQLLIKAARVKHDRLSDLRKRKEELIHAHHQLLVEHEASCERIVRDLVEVKGLWCPQLPITCGRRLLQDARLRKAIETSAELSTSLLPVFSSATDQLVTEAHDEADEIRAVECPYLLRDLQDFIAD